MLPPLYARLKGRLCTWLLLLATPLPLAAQTQAPDPWRISADKIDPSNYYGVTVANGMLGIVSAPVPFQVKNVVLAGAYDQYGRGRVSNFLNSFNLLNMYLEVDGHRLNAQDATNFRQQLDMQRASLTTTFDYQDKATISYTYYALRHLPPHGAHGREYHGQEGPRPHRRQRDGGARRPARRAELLQ